VLLCVGYWAHVLWRSVFVSGGSVFETTHFAVTYGIAIALLTALFLLRNVAVYGFRNASRVEALRACLGVGKKGCRVVCHMHMSHLQKILSIVLVCLLCMPFFFPLTFFPLVFFLVLCMLFVYSWVYCVLLSMLVGKK
jgi:hypothetical protein